MVQEVENEGEDAERKEKLANITSGPLDRWPDGVAVDTPFSFVGCNDVHKLQGLHVYTWFIQWELFTLPYDRIPALSECDQALIAQLRKLFVAVFTRRALYDAYLCSSNGATAFVTAKNLPAIFKVM